MKFYQLFFIGTLTFSANDIALAGGTPFDGFSGSYRVLESHCVNLVNNTPSNELALTTLTILPVENDKVVKIVHISDEFTNVLELKEENHLSTFSGDGKSSAQWIRNIEYGYLIRDVYSINRIGNKFRYSLEHRYFSDDSLGTPGNIHFRCDLDLTQ